MKKFLIVLACSCMLSALLMVMFALDNNHTGRMTIFAMFVATTCFMAGGVIFIWRSEIISLTEKAPKETSMQKLFRQLREAVAEDTEEGYKRAALIRNEIKNLKKARDIS